MKIIECPATIENPMPLHVFVAGGISNCPDWQQELCNQLSDMPDDLVMVNPRRHTFDVTDSSQTVFQIGWEREHLRQSDAVLFWFPSETLCPITLFELGKMIMSHRPVFVGCHPEYARRLDVIEQLKLERPEIIVGDSIEGLVSDVKGWYLSTVGICQLTKETR